jgi:hypothetical protein
MKSEDLNIRDEHGDGAEAGPPPNDGLDALLRSWHDVKRAEAQAGRDRLVQALKVEDARANVQLDGVAPHVHSDAARAAHDNDNAPRGKHRHTWIRRVIMNRYSPIVGLLIALAALLPFMLPSGGGGVQMAVAAKEQSKVVMAPEGGLLEAFDGEGLSLGPCALTHTDVNAEISGRFSRVTVKQSYKNPHPDKIEAVYTFPLSHRAGVDRMTMTIGDRVIVGEVKERMQARRIYEAARDSGRVASLLEQERPNIFTQSVANIEPGASIDIEISYVELVKETDGAFAFEFPTVVGPRYIPGTELPKSLGHEPKPVRGDQVDKGDKAAADEAREEPAFTARRGVVLLGPAKVRHGKEEHAAPGDDALIERLTSAVPIKAPDESTLGQPVRESPIEYADGSGETARVYASGIVEVSGRYGYCPVEIEKPVMPGEGGANMRTDAKPGEPFGKDTNKVPDASKITPMPTRPGVRAGHDISIRVSIDTGGAGIRSLSSGLHEVRKTDIAKRPDGLPSKVTIALANQAEIPNRDFVLSWTPTRDAIEPSVFTNTGAHGNFFLLQLEPPARVDDAQALPRELVFVLDTSGSMSGIPMAKSREIVANAIGAMRSQDTFNIITFAGDTHILWDKPRPSTEANKAEATAFVSMQRGGGGTEMMKAINAALEQRRPVRKTNVRDDGVENGRDADGKLIESSPLRIVMFLTDGYVGNDHAIIDAIKRNRGTTRVFSFGIGNSVNRYLLDAMASAGGGEVEYVLLGNEASTDVSDADAAVKRFNKRTSTPVLTDIRVSASDALKLVDVVPQIDGMLPDLFDAKPLMLIGRYTGAGSGSVTIRGRTANGPWEKTIDVTLPEKNPENTSLPTLWAKAKIEQLLGSDLAALQQGRTSDDVRLRVINLGETFGVMSPFTSFVAVDKLRVTIAGVPRLVSVPVELPDSTSFEGFFGIPGAAGFDELEAVNNVRLGKPAMRAELARALVTRRQSVEYRDVPGVDLNKVLGESPSGGGGGGQSPFTNVDGVKKELSEKSKPADRASAARRMSPVNSAPPTAPGSFAPSIGTPVSAAPASQSSASKRDEAAGDFTTGFQTRRSRVDSGGRKPEPLSTQSLSSADTQRINSTLTANLADSIDLDGSTPLLTEQALNNLAATQLTLEKRYADARVLVCPMQAQIAEHGAQKPQDQKTPEGDAAAIPPTDVQQSPEPARRGPRTAQDLVTDLCMILSSVKDDAELTSEQKEKIIAIQKEAAGMLEISGRARAIRRKLDESLLKMVPASVGAQIGDKLTPGATVASADGLVEVVVLLSDPSKTNVAELKALGMEVDSVNASTKVVAGRIKVAALETLALKGFVKRVEKPSE